MPYKLMGICTQPGCNARAVKDSRCASHPRKDKRNADKLNSSARGYGYQWRLIREQVLREYCIPEANWPLYDIDHTPPYDPAIEPDHRKYTLTPLLHSQHSMKTATIDRKPKHG